MDINTLEFCRLRDHWEYPTPSEREHLRERAERAIRTREGQAALHDLESARARYNAALDAYNAASNAVDTLINDALPDDWEQTVPAPF